jgi:hypothetical protein
MQEIMNDKNILNIRVNNLAFYNGIFLEVWWKNNNKIVWENTIDKVRWGKRNTTYMDFFTYWCSSKNI